MSALQRSLGLLVLLLGCADTRAVSLGSNAPLTSTTLDAATDMDLPDAAQAEPDPDDEDDEDDEPGEDEEADPDEEAEAEENQGERDPEDAAP